MVMTLDRGCSEIAHNAKRLYFGGTGDLVRVTHGCRVDEGNRRAAVFRFVLPSGLISIDGAGNLMIFVLSFTGARDLVFGHD
jgi:hypothetical protein